MPPFRSGAYSGELHPAFDTPEVRDWLSLLPSRRDLTPLATGRDRVYRASFPHPDAEQVAVKVFAAPPRAKQLLYRRRGGPAARAHAVGLALQERGVPTPRSIGFLERRERGRLVEQFHLTVYLDRPEAFREALIHHYYNDPHCGRIMALLEKVAEAVRLLHQAGVEHRDLGNQNILLRRGSQGDWQDVCFVDLNRAKLRTRPLSAAERGRDCARFSLPSDLRRVFFGMMWGEQRPPPAFLRAEKRTRRRYHFHTRTRVWRHPLRTRRRRKAQASTRQYPHPRDFWIWDDRSMQAIPAMRSRDRRRYYRKRDALGQMKALACRGWAIRRAFRTLLEEAWTNPVEMTGRVAVAINGEPERFPQEREFLNRLGPVPTHVRLYHHADPGQRRAVIDAVRALHVDGHEVSIAFVQDRRAVLHPRAWRAFVEDAAGSLSGFVSWAEAGHAINRVKWGVWDLPEYASLLSAFANWKERFPQIPLTGPAGIDFEVARVLPLLDHLPPGLCFDAFSHHMYVDRRGAPENLQGRFDTLGKLALLRAVARTHPACADRLIVSEVNWPLKGTGEWSPVGSPWVTPGPRQGDPSVDEEHYAAYMLRYLLIALCSGMAERVVWWNLAAHGFGLVDDRDPQGWRARPAYGVLQRFLQDMNGARFVRRETDVDQTVFRFAHPGGDFGYAHGAGQALALRVEA